MNASSVFNKINFILLFVLAMVISVGLYFAPKTFWNKIFGIKQTATAFTTANTGNWNATTTWGLNTGVLQLASAVGLFVSPINDHIYIADQSNSRVVVLNPDGTASTTYGGSTLYNGQALANPQGIAISSAGYIYVGDPNHSRLVVLNPDGTASTTYTNPAFVYPLSITIANNYIYVGDPAASKVVVINMDGTASTTFDGSASTTLGAFNPYGVAVNAVGEMYISDLGNARIVVLNPDNTASTTYDNLGLSDPSNISISSTGNILIADAGNSRIVVLNPDGTASTTYENLDAVYSPVGLSSPYGMHLSYDGKIYISDVDNGRIVVLNSDGTSLTKYGPNFPVSGYALTAGIDYPGIGSDVTLSTGSVTLTQNESVNDITLATGGTLNLNGFTLNVNGNWSNTGGTLNSGTGGTINLVSTSTQSIMGVNIFENLTKITATTSSLLFDPLNTTTINGTLHLAGTPGNILSINTNSGSLTPSFVYSTGSGPTGLTSLDRILVSPITNKIYLAKNALPYEMITLNYDGAVSTTTFGSGANTYFPYMNVGAMVMSPLSGDIYAKIYTSNSLSVITENGILSTSTLAEGLISNLSGFDISSDGKIYIADASNNKVVVLNPDWTIASTTYGLGTLSTYTSKIAVSPVTNKIYLTDTSDQYRMIVLNQDGTVASTTFASSSGVYMPYAAGMKVSPNGVIYFKYYSNQYLSGINEDGTIATTTIGQGLITNLYAFDFDASGNIYITDSTEKNILVFSPNGTLLNIYKAGESRKFNRPYGVAIDSSDNFYVPDLLLNNVQKFSSSGDFVSFLNTSATGTLDQPTDIAIDSFNNLFIADYGNNRITKFDSSGSYSSSSSFIDDAKAVEVDDAGNIYVAKNSPEEILKLDSNFNIIASTSTYNGNSFSMCEGSISLDPTQNYLYVVDSCNNKLVKLNTSNLAYVASSTGPVEAPFSNPLDTAFDDDNNIYVSDSNNRIIKLNEDFSYITQWGTSGTGNYQFNSPIRINIDSDNNLYVADQTNLNIKKFDLNIPFTPFNIIANGSTDFSYLNVSGSTNISSNIFYCTDNCTDVGGNTKWIFNIPPVPPTSVGSISIFLNNRANQNIGMPPGFDSNFIEISKKSTSTIVATTTQTETKIPVTKKEIEQVFSRNLDVGSTGKDVKQLQIFLNKLGFTISSSGTGSYGNETTYFGGLTKNSLNNFQTVYMKGLIEASSTEDGGGIFGPATMDIANKIFPEL